MASNDLNDQIDDLLSQRVGESSRAPWMVDEEPATTGSWFYDNASGPTDSFPMFDDSESRLFESTNNQYEDDDEVPEDIE
jgi:hypothetical protein